MSDINVILACDNGKPFYWNPLDKESTNPHVLITGTSGAGKTQLLKTISAELSKYGVPVIIFDKTGEYKELLEKNNGKIIDFDENIKLNPLILENQRPVDIANEIVSIFDKIFNKGLGSKQKNMLREIILESYMRRGIGENTITSTPNNSPTFEDIKQILYEKYKKNPKDNEINGIIARLNIFFDSQIFSGEQGLNFSNLLKPGITIIDLSKLLGRFGSDELIRAVIIFISKKLWDYLYSLKPVNKPELRAALILDEGHYYTFDGSPIDQMIREGRKYGISVILASQNLKDFKGNVINNTALKVALRVEDPSEKEKIRETYNVNEKMLPNEIYEGLIKWIKPTKLLKTVPYKQYKNHYNSEEICKEIKYHNQNQPESSQEKLAINNKADYENLKSKEESQEINNKNLSLKEIIDEAVKENNLILLDALYQFHLNPNSMSVGYGLPSIYSDIENNLALRYNLNDAKTTTNYLKKIIESLIKINPDVYQIEDNIYEELIKSGGLYLLKQDSLNRIKKLSEKDQLIIYSLLATSRYMKQNFNTSNIYSTDRWRYEEDLKGIDKNIELDYALNLSIKINAYSRLMWKSSGSGDIDWDFYSHDFIDDIINELNDTNIVKNFKEKFEKAVKKAIDLWNIDILRILLDLNYKDYICYDDNAPNVVVNGINGPEDYMKTLANYIIISNNKCVDLVPSWLKDSLKNSIEPLIKFISEKEEKTGAIIEDFIKQRIPYVNRESLKDNCFIINVSSPDYKQESIKICFDPIFDYNKLSAEVDNIYVSILSPVNLCGQVEKSKYKLGLIILTPYKTISCSNSLNKEAKELFSKITKAFESNLDRSVF